MKRAMCLIFPLAAAFAVSAQKLRETKVPAAVKASLNKMHPGIRPVWEMEHACYEANFTEAGKAVSVTLDGHGTIVETETAVPLTSLPAEIRTYVQDHFKGKKIREITRIVKANVEVNYEVEVNKKDLLFDASGKRIGKKEKGKD